MAGKFIAIINEDTKEIMVTGGSLFGALEKGIVRLTNPLGAVIYINAGYNTDDFSSPDITAVTAFTNALTLSGTDILLGTYTLSIKTDVTGVVTTYPISITYCLTMPEVTASVSHLCSTSSITSTDTSDYNATCTIDGSELAPNAYTRTHTLAYPADILGGAPADVVSANATVSVVGIYTHNWRTTISTALSYLISASRYTGSLDYVQVIATVHGGEDHWVACDSCMCTISTCLSKLTTRYYTALGSNPTEASRYGDILLALLGYLQVYTLHERCGNLTEVQADCARIKAVIELADCTCCDGTDTEYAQFVEAIGVVSGQSIVGGTGGTSLYFGDGVPSTSIGSNGDSYFDTLTGNIYQMINNAWVFQYNTTGATGAAGAAGNTLLYSDPEFHFLPIGQAGWYVLDTFSLPNTITNTFENGDELVLKATFSTAYDYAVSLNINIDGSVGGGDGDSISTTRVIDTSDIIAKPDYKDVLIEIQMNVEKNGSLIYLKTLNKKMYIGEAYVEYELQSTLPSINTKLNTLGNTNFVISAQGTATAAIEEVILKDVKIEYYKYA